MSINDVVSNKNSLVIISFMAYLAAILIFAVLYYLMYRRNRAHFLFATAIAKAQLVDMRSSTKREILAETKKVDILYRLVDLLQPQVAVLKKTKIGEEISLPDGCRVVFQAKVFLAGPDRSASVTIPEMTLFDADGENLGTWWENSDQSDFSMSSYRRLTERHLATAEYTLKGLRKRLQGLSDTSAEIWSLWDFVYFSTITQTTVGYGDILPNSTAVRKIVMLQILIGYSILIVLINLFVS